MEIMGRKRPLTIHILILLYFIFAAFYVTYPLILHLDEYIFGIGDELLITWILNWDIHSYLNNIFSIYNSPIFYPHSNTLTFTDTFFTSALIGLFPYLFSKEPLTAYNFNVIFSVVSLGYSTYLLSYLLSKNYYAGVISGTLMAFSVYMVTRYFHLQLVSTFWLPLSFYFLFSYFIKRKFRYIIGLAIAFIFQAANSIFPVYLMFFSLAIVIFTYISKDRRILNFLLSKKNLIIAVITGVVVLSFGLPYIKTSQKYNYVRDIRDTIRFANRPEYFLYPSNKTKMYAFLTSTFYKRDQNPIKHDGYYGLTPIVLSFLAICYLLTNKKARNHKAYIVFLYIAVFAFIMSLGPAFQWKGKVIKNPRLIPLPYTLFYYLLPGFKGFRNSARWELLLVFSLSVMSGIFFAEKTKKMKNYKQFLLTFILVISIFLELNLPFKFEKFPYKDNYPAVYASIASLNPNVRLLEMPIYNWNFLPYALNENKRMIYNTLHYRPTVNGTSGFFPFEWQSKTLWLNLNFPSIQTITYLKSINVTHVILHTDEYKLLLAGDFKIDGKNMPAKEKILEKLKEYHTMKLLMSFNPDYLYEIIDE